MHSFYSNDYNRLHYYMVRNFNLDKDQYNRFWEIIGEKKWNNNVLLYYDDTSIYFDKYKQKNICDNKSFMDDLELAKSDNYRTEYELKKLYTTECEKCNRNIGLCIGYLIVICSLLSMLISMCYIIN